MTRCRICGQSACHSCNSPQRPDATAGDLFESLLSESLPVESRPISGDSGRSTPPPESVWASARLHYFRDVSARWPADIGFHGCQFPPDGAYRLLDPFWLAWLNSRVESLQGAAKAAGRRKLHEIVIEGINARSLPESLDNPDQWPRIVPAGYEPPTLEISAKFWPMAVDDSQHVR